MPNFPKPVFNLHKDLSKQIEIWKQDPSCTCILLKYSLSPHVEATIASDVSNPMLIPLPGSPSPPYRGWSDWFKRYLEVQIELIARYAGLPAYVKTNRGKFIKIEQVQSTDVD